MWPKIETRIHGELCAQDCLALTFFLHASHADARARVAEAVERVLEFAGPRSFPLYLDEQGEDAPLDAQRWPALRAERFGPDREESGLRLISEDDVSGCYLKYWGWELPQPQLPGWRNQFHVRLSRALVQQRGGRWSELVAFARGLAELLPYSSGYLNPALALSQRTPACWGIGRRHPGLDLLDPDTTCIEIGEQIPGVYWTMFVGAAARATPSMQALAAAPPPGLTTAPAGEGVLLQLGDVPDIGDANHGQGLHLFRSIASTLWPEIYVPDRPHLFDEDDEPDLDSTRRWQRRFVD